MNITLAFIADYLKSRGFSAECCDETRPYIHGVRMLLPDTVHTAEDIVYILRPAKLSPEYNIQSTTPYILVGEDDARFKGLSRMIVKDTGSAKLYQELLDMFQLFDSWQQEIYAAILQGGSIQTLLSLSHGIFLENTLSVTNSTLTVLGYVSPSGPGLSGPDRKEDAGRSYIDFNTLGEKSVERFLHTMEKEKRNPPVFTVEQYYSREWRMISAWLTMPEGECYGKLSITETGEPLREYHLTVAQYLSERLCEVLRRDAMSLMRAGMIGTDFMVDALQGKLKNRVLAEQELSLWGWHGNDTFRVLLFQTDKTALSERDLYYYFSSSVSNILHHARTAFFSGHLVVIYRSGKDGALTPEIKESLSALAAGQNAVCGISSSYSDFLLTPYAYRQAYYAAHHASETIQLYENCMLQEIVDKYAVLYPPEMRLCPDISALAEYDRKHKSELIKTLYTYLLCDRSYTLCSEELHIHRSTLRYRLITLRRFLDVDALSGQNKLLVLLSARMYLAEKE